MGAAGRKPRVAALVPMRAGSERVPDKNIRPFAGKPLYERIVGTLLACPSVAEIVINTDSEAVLRDAPRLSERVRVIERPEHLRAGTVEMNDVLLYDVARVEADYYLQTHATNPLLRAETVERALAAFFASGEHDSLFGVTRVFVRLWGPGPVAINHDPDVLLRTQDLPPVYEENSNLYLFDRATLEARGSRIGERPMLFEIDRAEAWDIDDMLDFEIAEFLYLRRGRAEKD